MPVDRITGQTFINQEIHLDGKRYVKCVFRNCLMIYAGGDGGELGECVFDNCKWQFDGAAARTIGFMRGMYHGAGRGGRELIEKAFNDIRTPPDESE